MPDKLLWRAISDGARRFPEEYDLAVAFLEGGSAYYVADHVRAKKKRRRLSISTIRRRDTAGNWTATATCNMMPYFRSGNR